MPCTQKEGGPQSSVLLQDPVTPPASAQRAVLHSVTLARALHTSKSERAASSPFHAHSLELYVINLWLKKQTTSRIEHVCVFINMYTQGCMDRYIYIYIHTNEVRFSFLVWGKYIGF